MLVEGGRSKRDAVVKLVSCRTSPAFPRFLGTGNHGESAIWEWAPIILISWKSGLPFGLYICCLKSLEYFRRIYSYLGCVHNVAEIKIW